MYGASNDQQPLVSNYSCANQQSDWEQRAQRMLHCCQMPALLRSSSSCGPVVSLDLDTPRAQERNAYCTA